jgi:hypothetical protein
MGSEMVDDTERCSPPIVEPTQEPPERVELLARVFDAIATLETRIDACEQRHLQQETFDRSPSQSLN